MAPRFRGNNLKEIWASYFFDGKEEAHGNIEAGVLANLGNKRTHATLDAFERRKSGERQSEIFEKGLDGFTFSPDGYRQIHGYLFQDVYEWAGEDRQCTLGKGGSTFSQPHYIDMTLEDIFTEINEDKNLKGLSAEDFSERSAEYMNRLNGVHAFREGNGRTNRTFLHMLGEEAGHKIDINKIDPDEWNEASRQGFITHSPDMFAEVIRGAIVDRDLERGEGDKPAPASDPDDPEARRLAEYRARGEAAETKHEKAMDDKAKAPAQEPGQKPGQGGQDIDD